MPQDMNTIKANEFSRGIELLSRQMISKLKAHVQVENMKGAETWFMNQLGTSTVNETNSLWSATTYNNTSLARRVINKKTFTYNEPLPEDELNDVNFDPTSDLVKSIMAGYAVNYDDLIIEAAVATASTGKDGTGTANLTTAANVIGNDVGGADSGMNYTKLLTISKRFIAGDVNEGEVNLMIGPEQVVELLNDDKFINADFNRIQKGEIAIPLLTGYLATVNLGRHINIFTSTRLLAANDAKIPAGVLDATVGNTANDRVCFAFTRGGIGLGVGSEVKVSFNRATEFNNQLAIYSNNIAGAARLDEDKVQLVICRE